MNYARLGSLSNVSRLTLGGGGIGQVWGATDRDEAIATVRMASAAGINLFDMAPLYGRGEAETVMGLAFETGYPDDLKVTTKCMLGDTPADDIEARLLGSLEKSCERLRRDSVDLFILQGYVIADDLIESERAEVMSRIGVRQSRYIETVVPAFEKLKASGRIGGWGVTAASTQAENLAVLSHADKPDVIQCITNLLDSPGGMAITREPPDPRAIIAEASKVDVGVMGIRAVAAGSLTSDIDRETPEKSAETRDWRRAAPFRDLAAELGKSPAYLAHQYALTMPGVDTVVLGVKNREELDECLQAEAAGPMADEIVAAIDDALRPAALK